LTEHHWFFMGLTTLLFAALTAVALSISPEKPLFRWGSRAVFASGALMAGSALGFMGFNLVNLVLITLFGVPGFGALLLFSCA